MLLLESETLTEWRIQYLENNKFGLNNILMHKCIHFWSIPGSILQSLENNFNNNLLYITYN